jgi:hypothetical protein
MSIPFPAEIQVTELPDEVQYSLPRRPPNRFHLLGHLGLIAFGLVVGGLPFWLTGVPAIQLLLAGGPGVWLHLVALLHVMPFTLIGAALIVWCMLMLFGSCAIEIADGTIRTVERAGPFYWTRSRPVECIRSLDVRFRPKWSSVTRFLRKQQTRIGPPADFGDLRVECEDAKTLTLVLWYPRRWLRPLADDLAERLTPATTPTRFPMQQAAVEVTETFLVPPGYSKRSGQPDMTTAGLVIIALGCLVAGIGVCLAVGWYRFASTALRTEGIVVRMVRGNDDGTSAPVVRYQAGRHAFELKGSVYSSPPAYSVGEKVHVRYQRDQPGAGRIDSFTERGLAPLLCAGSGVILMAVGLVVISGRPRRHSRGRRARAGSAN